MGVLLRRLSTGELGCGFPALLWGRRSSFGMSLTGFVGRFATEEALDEIYRVLKEGAVFGMIWNIDDCEIALHPGHPARSPPSGTKN